MNRAPGSRRFTAQGTNQGFICTHCSEAVPPLQNGSYRNHCPFCLYSLHVDVFPGDRANACKGLLEPTSAEHNGKKGWVIVYRCTRCGQTGRNKAALDDAVPDDFERIVALTVRT